MRPRSVVLLLLTSAACSTNPTPSAFPVPVSEPAAVPLPPGAVDASALAQQRYEEGRAQSCDVLAAALRSAQLEPTNAILVEQTGMGVPQFAFMAYTTVQRGDTALYRLADPPLRTLNATRHPLPSCLKDDHGWELTADSTLFALFSSTGSRWTGFREQYAKQHFALVSLPLVLGDTATVYVASASGERAGRGIILRLVRQANGTWRKESEVQVWVS